MRRHRYAHGDTTDWIKHFNIRPKPLDHLIEECQKRGISIYRDGSSLQGNVSDVLRPVASEVVLIQRINEDKDRSHRRIESWLNILSGVVSAAFAVTTFVIK